MIIDVEKRGATYYTNKNQTIEDSENLLEKS